MERNAIQVKNNNRIDLFQIVLYTAISFILISFCPAQIAERTLQENTVKGKITDAYTGNPLGGVTIQIYGTDKAVKSDKDGSYSITYTDQAEKLVVSHSGYQTLELTISGRQEINVAMTQEYDNDPKLWY